MALQVLDEWFLSEVKNNKATVADRLEMFFFDADLMPLMVQVCAQRSLDSCAAIISCIRL